jgi:hypothetical protein
MDERVRPSCTRVEREPELQQRAQVCPRRTSMPVYLCQMLGESSQEDIPTRVAGAAWLIFQQAKPCTGRLRPVVLQELRDQPPPPRLVSPGHQLAQIRHRKRLVDPAMNLTWHGDHRNVAAPERLQTQRPRSAAGCHLVLDRLRKTSGAQCARRVAFTMRQQVQADLEADRKVATTLAELIIGGLLASAPVSPEQAQDGRDDRTLKPCRPSAAISSTCTRPAWPSTTSAPTAPPGQQFKSWPLAS